LEKQIFLEAKQMQNFRTYDLAVAFYIKAKKIRLPAHLSSQFLRASSSIALNLAEGRGKRTRADQLRFFQIALGSARECEAVFALESASVSAELSALLDHLIGSLCRLLERAL
jgi:four helix bundle protein